jgi:hypothetical protein
MPTSFTSFFLDCFGAQPVRHRRARLLRGVETPVKQPFGRSATTFGCVAISLRRSPQNRRRLHANAANVCPRGGTGSVGHWTNPDFLNAIVAASATTSSED